MGLISFSKGSEYLAVKVNGNNLYIMQSSYSTSFVPFNEKNVKLSHSGVIREHPDLKDNPNWAEEAVKRLKIHLDKLGTEKARLEYIRKELEKNGYQTLRIQEDGHRPQAVGNL